jgi:hypothetical protein
MDTFVRHFIKRTVIGHDNGLKVIRTGAARGLKIACGQHEHTAPS